MDENKDRLSTDDMQIFQEAVAQHSQAAANRQFVEGFLTRKYNLQNGDSLDVATGKITRKGSD